MPPHSTFIRRTACSGALLLSLTLTGVSASALELTDQPGVTTSAGSCYLGCGHAQYDSANIIDGDYGATGNTGFNSWNSGFWGGWVQVDFTRSFVLDRIELYGVNGYFDPFTLLVSTNGSSWSTLVVGGYHNEPRLTHTGVGGARYGAVYDVADHTLASSVEARYLRYSVNSGSPHWGYLVEVDVQGHLAAAPVPELETYSLMASGLALLGWLGRRQRRFGDRSGQGGA